MIVPKLQGRHVFLLKRCSTVGQTGSSLHNQDTATAELIRENKVIVVDEEELAGVTGSVPGARDDIDKIIALKRGGLHFDVLLLPTTDRFTRAGSLHANKMLWDLEGAGIVVYFASENLWSDDRMHRLILGFMFDAAQQSVMANGRSSLIGVSNRFLEGHLPSSRRPPYGFDRLYSADGKALHIIRNLADGTQQMLHPETGELIRTFDRNPKKGTPAHYVKQKNESVHWIPGDPQRVETVLRIYETIHVERRSIHSVTKELNDAGIPSPYGTSWDWSVVKNIAFNPVYVGILISGRTSRAIYYMTASGAPEEVKLDPMELRDNKRPLLRERGREKWLLRQDPALQKFLSESTGQVARAAIEADLASKAQGLPRQPRSRDRHRNSTFILKDVLRASQGGHRMTGKICGRGGDHRYYRSSKGQNAPKSDNVLARTVPATPLEGAVIGVLREVLLSRPDLERAVRTVVERHLAKIQTPTQDRSQIERELKRKQKQIAAALDHLSGDADADAPLEQKLAGYRGEAARMQMLLAAVPKPTADVDVDGLVRRLTDELIQFGERLDAQDNEIVRQMVGLLVGRMEVDLLTRETEIDLRLPGWLGHAAATLPMMGFDRVIPWNITNETHQADGAEIATYRCQQTTKRPACFECRRMRRAA